MNGSHDPPLSLVGDAAFHILYGRETALATLRGTTSGITVVSGDMGIGKSALLVRAIDNDHILYVIAPQPATLRYSSGSLRRALLKSLLACVEEIAHDKHAAETLASHVAEAAKRLAKEKAMQVPRVVGAVILGFIKDRVGSEVTDAIGEFWQELGATFEDDLQGRLEQAADEDTVAVLVAFAEEVQKFAQRRIVLSLDGGERLSDEDVALLKDLANSMPANVEIRLGFATPDAASQQRVDSLRLAGAHVVELSGLGVSEVAAWMRQSGLDPAAAAEVTKQMDGNPYRIELALAYLGDGGDLQQLQATDALTTVTDQSWDSLPPGVAAIARQLSAFSEPPALPRLIAMLDVNLAEWAEVERRLVHAKVFSAKVDGRRWFHELRRRHVWENIVSAPERIQYARLAVTELLQESLEDHRYEVLGALARIASEADLSETQPEAACALEVGPDALAVTGAVIELTETGPSAHALTSHGALGYARAVFGSSGDLVAGLHETCERGLLSVIERPHGIFLMPTWQSPLVPAILAGRASNERGRLPIVGVASMIFWDGLQPMAGAYISGFFGMGSPSMQQLASGVPPRREGSGPNAPVLLGTRQPSMALKGTFGGAPMYACLSYSADAERDAALGDVHNLNIELLDIPFSVLETLAVPYDAVPARRFLRAAELIIGKRISSSFGISIDAPLPIEQYLETQAEMLKRVRATLSPSERYAYELEEPMGFVLWKAQSDAVYASVIGGSEGVHLLQGEMPQPQAQPHVVAEMCDRAGLAPYERLGELVQTFGASTMRTDPALDVLLGLNAKAYAFNKLGERHPVMVAQDHLEVEILHALSRRREDAARIADLLHVTPVDPKWATPRRHYVVIIPLAPSLWRYGGQYLVMCWMERLDGRDMDEVQVRFAPVLDQELTLNGYDMIFQDVFGLDGSKMSRTGLRAADTLADLLGFNAEHIRLEFPDDASE